MIKAGNLNGKCADLNALFVGLARAAGIATCSVVMPGEGHTFDVWSDAFRQALPFFAKRLRLPPEPAENPEPCRD